MKTSYTAMCLDGRQIYAFQEQLFFSHSLCLFSNPEIYPQILLNQHIKNPILKFALKRWEYQVLELEMKKISFSHSTGKMHRETNTLALLVATQPLSWDQVMT